MENDENKVKNCLFLKTILEIGGQDSKIIILRDGIVTDFAMNTVCAAGTGSFLDQQASRMNVPIQDFGSIALQSKSPAKTTASAALNCSSVMERKNTSAFSAIRNGSSC